MPTNRTRITRGFSGHAITPAAIAAWQQGDFHLVNKLLQVKPWQVSPFDAVGALPGGADPWARSWPRAAELRAALLAICPPGRMGRHGEPLGPS